MSAQPPKRRKTSPMKATPVFNRTNAESASASRASYMSPTRASLSRFNPSLLPQARSASAGPASAVSAAQNGVMTPDQFLAQGQEAFNYIMGNFNAQMQRTLAAMGGNNGSPLVGNQAAIMTPSVLAGKNDTGPTGAETDEQMEAMRSAIRARKQLEGANARRATNSARSTPMTARRRAGSVPSHVFRQDDDDELSMEIGRNDNIPRIRAGSARPSLTPRSAIKSMTELTSRLSHSGVDDLSMDIDPVVDEELQIDELSPDAVLPQRILSSPARRRKVENPRVQRLGTEDNEGDLPDTPDAIRRQMEVEDHPRRGVLFSSPSKRRKTVGGSPRRIRLSPRKETESVESVGSPEKEPEVVPKPVVASGVETAALAKQDDPRLLEKREEKARLEAELRDLRKEVDQFERFTRIYTSKDAELPTNIKPVLDLLTSQTTSKEQAPQPALSTLLTSFLPFSIPVAPVSTPEKPSEDAEASPQFVSHAPLKEKDPLPLNSLFTPLSITSVTHPPTQLSSGKLRQKHDITLTSPGGLLTCALGMTVTSEHAKDTVPRIENLEMSDLSSWAKGEIGHWMGQRCKEGDVAAVGYGMGRYWDLSVKRARCWMLCRKEFAHLLTHEGRLEESEEPTTQLDDSALETKVSKKALLPNLGRSVLILRSDEAMLTISWKLQFDWTGDVESVVSVEAGLPDSWREADSSDALRKIPATFDVLMREGGVLKAVRVVAGLLFDTQV